MLLHLCVCVIIHMHETLRTHTLSLLSYSLFISITHTHARTHDCAQDWHNTDDSHNGALCKCRLMLWEPTKFLLGVAVLLSLIAHIYSWFETWFRWHQWRSIRMRKQVCLL